MNIDVNALQAKIRTNHAAALAKRAGAQISPEVAATIREAYREGASIRVIRESLREMGVNMSPTMVKNIAKSPTPRRKKTTVPKMGGSTGTPAAPVLSGTMNQAPIQSSEVPTSIGVGAPNGANGTKSALAGLTEANAATRPGARR